MHQYSLNFSCNGVETEYALKDATDVEKEVLRDVRVQLGPDIEKLCFVDTETTGAFPLSDRIIEIALIKFSEVSPDNWRLEKYVALVNPEGKKSSAGALRVHKISDDSLFLEKTCGEQSHEIKNFFGDRKLVAQNARFDKAFIKKEFQRIGETCSNKWFCSKRHFKKFNPNLKHYGLQSVCKHYGIGYDAHRAEADALAIIQLFHRTGAIRNHRFRP